LKIFTYNHRKALSILKSIEKQILGLMDIAKTVQAKELVAIYENRGYKEITIRNTLSQLKKMNIIEATARGTYQITIYGQKAFGSLNAKHKHIDETFADSWCIVIMQIPEIYRKQKDAVKSILLDLGFAQYYSNIYISPWDYKTAVKSSLERFGLINYANIIQGSFLMKPITTEQACSLWGISALQTLYTEKDLWLQEKFPDGKKTIRNADDLTLFNDYLDLQEHIDHIFLVDPFIPVSLLPTEWPGNRILKQFIALHEYISSEFPIHSSYYKFIKKC